MISAILLFTGKADPGPFIKHPSWIPFAVFGTVVSLVLAGCYFYLCAIYFRRYRVARATWLPVSLMERIDAQVNKQRSYTRGKFAALRTRQPEPDLDRLRRVTLACLVADYAVWGVTAFVIIPHLF
ncbi:MAG: hypothetical protein M3176_03225 [Chloroflexota bacterium]|nr:hypothetical protein [Chloroflexota bacterium]